ncbi:hypothetical protein QTG54_002915 [Skeletonema marinoi]|uniref:Tetratricopeptide repeat protein 1 n=1 Tax=Skeletonema marinoi TaxID=267567 RepID=A0AAD9DI00_9STRA|nr:hypothetical protein QTG54_002915 [Skeletonema marinoi]
MPTETKFDSEGFDLGASDNKEAAEVIYEMGGGATSIAPPLQKEEEHKNSDSSPIAEAERLKELGNNEFRQKNHLDAFDYYTDAIEASPMGEGMGPSGKELLKLREEYDEEQRERQAERHRRDMERRRGQGKDTDGQDKKDEDDGGNNTNDDEEEEQQRPAEFTHRDTHMDQKLQCTAYEHIEDTEGALRDAKRAYELDPTNAVARKNVARLQKIEEERLEKLKEETMGKLKDLGNSILGNFGLSLDNFAAVQDPNTGGYSISFNQNK